jgi:hypothetical protein
MMEGWRRAGAFDANEEMDASEELIGAHDV